MRTLGRVPEFLETAPCGHGSPNMSRDHRERFPNTSLKDRRGSALLAVLWLSAALAAIAFSVSTSVRSETDRVASAADGLRAWYLATGSVERGIQWMCWGPDYAPRFW